MNVIIHRTAQRGGEFREEFDLRIDRTNLSDIVVEASGSVDPGAEVLIKPDIAVDTTTTGVASCVLSLTPTQTEELPDRIIVDVRARVPSASISNTLVLRMHLAVEPTSFPA